MNESDPIKGEGTGEPVGIIPLAGGRRVTGERVSSHRMGRFSKETGALLCEWNATSPDPWRRKAKSRARAKRAKQSRKANR